MQFDDLQPSEPEIEAAIDYNPLTVTTDTRLIDVIALMNQRRIHSCSLSNANSHEYGFPTYETGSTVFWWCRKQNC